MATRRTAGASRSHVSHVLTFGSVASPMIGTSDPRWPGASLVAVGLAAAAFPHGIDAGARSADALLLTAIAVTVAAGATTVGCAVLLEGARSPSRHVFRFGALRRLAVTLSLIGVLDMLLMVCFGDLAGAWTYGAVSACSIACLGSIFVALLCLSFAAVAGRLAWHAHQEERYPVL